MATTEKTEDKATGQAVNVTIVQPDRAAEGARAMAEGKELAMDVTVPGGKYLVGGQFVDADGNPLKGEKG
jgi:hypothetical protein